MRTIICKRCHEITERTGNNQWYCKECAEIEKDLHIKMNAELRLQQPKIPSSTNLDFLDAVNKVLKAAKPYGMEYGDYVAKIEAQKN